MGTVGPSEILVIFVVALLVLGPQKLPEAARSVGRVIGEIRRYTSDFQDEVRGAFAEPNPSAAPPPPATASETVSGGSTKVEAPLTSADPDKVNPDNGDAPAT